MVEVHLCPTSAPASSHKGDQVRINENAHLYATEPDSLVGAAVVSALQQLDEAAQQAQRRAVLDLGMNHADVLATRYLLQADRDGQCLSPTDLSKLLGMTTAAASKLVDRLVEAGKAERVAHPTDKRAQIIVPTPAAAADVLASYSLIHTPLVKIINELTSDEARAIVLFSEKLTSALATPPMTR
jgi:DNA-binding MarR family transcriptional regulator